jgi:hypothetical protein
VPEECWSSTPSASCGPRSSIGDRKVSMGRNLDQCPVSTQSTRSSFHKEAGSTIHRPNREWSFLRPRKETGAGLRRVVEDFRRGRRDEKQQQRRLCHLILCAYEALTLAHLTQALRIDTEDSKSDYERLEPEQVEWLRHNFLTLTSESTLDWAHASAKNIFSA